MCHYVAIARQIVRVSFTEATGAVTTERLPLASWKLYFWGLSDTYLSILPKVLRSLYQRRLAELHRHRRDDRSKPSRTRQTVIINQPRQSAGLRFSIFFFHHRYSST